MLNSLCDVLLDDYCQHHRLTNNCIFLVACAYRELNAAFAKPAAEATTASASGGSEESCDETSATAPPQPPQPHVSNIVAIVVPPTASASQQAALSELAARFSILFVVSIPRNVLEGLQRKE